MQPKCSYNNSVFSDENIDAKTDSVVPYNYKKRRDELNKIVTNHIATQQKKLHKKTNL